MSRQAASFRLRVQAQNFTGFTFRDDLERTAANFAIRREPLKSRAGIHHDLERLSAEGTGDFFGNFHKPT